jgi:hypothetical protein
MRRGCCLRLSLQQGTYALGTRRQPSPSRRSILNREDTRRTGTEIHHDLINVSFISRHQQPGSMQGWNEVHVTLLKRLTVQPSYESHKFFLQKYPGLHVSCVRHHELSCGLIARAGCHVAKSLLVSVEKITCRQRQV